MNAMTKRITFTREEERELFERYKAGDGEAGNLLARYGLGLLPKIRWQFRAYKVDMEEIESLSHTALAKALRDYDPDKGRFATHLTTKVWSAIKDFQRTGSTLIKIPRLILKTEKESHGVRCAARIASLDVGFSDESNREGQSRQIPDKRQFVSGMEATEDIELLKRRYSEVLRRMMPQHAQAVALRHAGLRMREVSERLGVSESRVSQILSQALPEFERIAGVENHVERLKEAGIFERLECAPEADKPDEIIVCQTPKMQFSLVTAIEKAGPMIYRTDVEKMVNSLRDAIGKQEATLRILREQLLWTEKLKDIAVDHEPPKRRGRPAGSQDDSLTSRVMRTIRDNPLGIGPSKIADELGREVLAVSQTIQVLKKRGMVYSSGRANWKATNGLAT